MSRQNLNKVKKKKARKIKKSAVVFIAVSVVLICSIISLLITNLFIPVKYFSAYTVKPEENEKGTMRKERPLRRISRNSK